MTNSILKTRLNTRLDVGLNLGLISFLCILIFCATFIGTGNISTLDLLKGLYYSPENPHSLIIWHIRLPRILLGLMIGFTLGLSGAALQGFLRNPLADAGLLGVSSSSGLGAIVAIYYGLAAISAILIPITALAMALIATFIILFLANRDSSTVSLILAGLAISSIMGSLSALALSLAPTPMSLQDMMMWLMGSLMNSSWTEVILAAPFMAIGCLLVLSVKHHLSALTLGHDVAQSMGIDLIKTQRFLVLGIALMVSAGVAVAGIIGFIGMIVPHIVRPFVGYDPAKSLIPSGLVGAGLLLITDIIARLPILSSELRIGVLTSLIGAPVFLWVLIKSQRERR